MDKSPVFIDLSVAIDPKEWEPEPVEQKILDHQQGADLLGKSFFIFHASGRLHRIWLRVLALFQRRITYRDFPDGMGLSLMIYKLTTHTGTHLDAPYHYGWRDGTSTIPRTIDDVPLSWCYGEGVLLDFSNEPYDSPPIKAVEIQNKLQDIGYTIKENDIVLIATGADAKVGTREYFTQYRAISKEAVAWLVEQGVHVIGMDTFSFDPPFTNMLQKYTETGDNSVLWPAHFYGRDKEYIQIERLTNLRSLPRPVGFKLSCFPIKLKGADAAWSRVVAIFDEKNT
ncbi:MAG: cyclase family protein [Candidatus Parabeggiatoa sp.]|nr:cyclase family protein [Candidatus Parabeggiatoa sp.]